MSERPELPRSNRRDFLQLSLFGGSAALASGWLAGCQPAQPNPPAAPQPAAPAQPAPAAPRSQLDEWVVALSEDITSIDPLFDAGGAIRFNVIYHTNEPLVGYEGPTFQPVPRLAESWSYLNDNTLELKLRRNVKFHNGDDFTADDVLYTYQIHKSDPRLGTGFLFDPVEALEKVDSHTVHFVTKGPVATLLPNLAQVFLIAPQGRETIGAEAFGRRPVGTGMYKLAQDWTRDQPVRLVANETYWGGPPSLPRLQFRFIREPSTRVAELQNGTVQVIENVPLPQVELLKRGANTDVVTMKAARIIMNSINLTREPFTDLRVRQAMNLAVDREVIARNVLQGFGRPHVGLFAEGWMGHRTDLQPYAHDPQRARQLLAEAGLPNGFEFEWQVTDGVFLKDREIGEAVAAQLQQAGITARLRVTERGAIFDSFYSGKYDLISTQWPTTADPERYLQWLFIRTAGAAESKETEPVREMMDEARRILDPEKRSQKYQELGKLAYERAMLLFIHVQDELYGIDKRTGWMPSPIRAVAAHHWYTQHPSIKR